MKSTKMKAKRILILVICVCLIIPQVLLENTSEASAASNAVVIVNTLNVRVGPGTEYARVVVDGVEAYLVGQQELEILSVSGSWAKIKAVFRGKEISGYVFAEYVAYNSDAKATETPTPTPTATPTPTPISKYEGAEYELPGTVTANTLNVRADGDRGSAKLGSTTYGTPVLILNEKQNGDENWYRVVLTLDGKEQIGYMLSDYVKLSTTRGLYARTKESGVNLKISASLQAAKTTDTDGKVISLGKNRNVWIYDEVTDVDGIKWFHIRITISSVKYYGYLRADEVALYGYLSNKNQPPVPTETPAVPTKTPDSPTKVPQTPTPTEVPYVKLVDGEEFQVPAKVVVTTINLREEPNTACDVLAKLSFDAETLIVNEEDRGIETWYRVVTKVDGKQTTGYLYGKYLKLTLERPVKAVISESKTRIRISAGTAGAYLKTVEGNILALGAGHKVSIISQTTMDSLEWFEVSFNVNGTSYTGFAQMSDVDFEVTVVQPTATPIPSSTPTPTPIIFPGHPVTSTPAPSPTPTQMDLPTPTPTETPTPTPTPYLGPGMIYGVGTSLIMKTEPGYSGTTVKNSVGTSVLLKNGRKVTVIGNKYAEDVDWYEIKVTFGYEELTGYVNVKYVDTTSPELYGETNSSDLSFEAQLAAQRFPESYKQYLRVLHAQYPKWVFNAYHTGLDWNTVLDNEDIVGTNLIPNSKAVQWKSLDKGAYNWKTDSFIVFDGSYWVTVSREGLAYYLDPRNWLVPDYVFQFEVLTYQPSYQKQYGVENILKNTLLYNNFYTYQDDNGLARTLSYGATFIEAAAYSNVSPYHLASRVKQEVVTGTKSLSNSVSGTVAGLEGLYNFYNVGAYHSTVAGGNIANGLKYARDGGTNAATNLMSLIPWTSQYRSIVGGAYLLGVNYINRGQDTIYLQKFNMTPKSTYYHQYMANVEAPWAEGKKVFAAYGSEAAELPIVFSIPVFLNMPAVACQAPAEAKNPNNWLKKLEITDIDGKALALTPTFDLSKEQEYTLFVGADCGVINMSGTTVSTKAVITGNGYVPLETGLNRLTLSVLAENGSVRNYVVNVIRESAS